MARYRLFFTVAACFGYDCHPNVTSPDVDRGWMAATLQVLGLLYKDVITPRRRAGNTVLFLAGRRARE
jgi:hypothetical protein